MIKINSVFKILNIILLVLLAVLVWRSINEEPEIITETKTEFIKVTDTIVKFEIKEVPVPKEIQIIKDSIIYLEKSEPIKDEPILKANQFNTKLETQNATADLSILTTGQLLDVQGVINYKKEITTVKETKIINKNNAFLYLQSSVIPELKNYQIGIDYTIKNKVIVGTSFGYDTRSNLGSINLKIGFKLF